MKKIVTALFLFCSYGLHAQTGDSAVLRSLSDEIMLHGTCYDNLRELTLNIGHRLSGSPAAAKAVLWAEAALKEAGADTVWLQPALVPHWVRGEESLFIQMDKEEKYEPVAMLSLGNTEGTGGKLLEKEIIYVPDFKTFDALSESAVKGRVVFFDYHFRQDIINTFKGYRDAVVYRWEAASKAAAKQAAAVIIRSTSTAPDDVPHAGSAHYEKGVKHIPAVAIGNLSADRLAKACKKGHPKARLISNCRFEQPVKSYNVIGSLKGSEKPDEYMVVAGHLDSWDVGEGAQDDGAGIVQSIEVLRTLKKMNMRPRHTLRVVCYMNEENGIKGALAYADSALKHKEHHIFAMESDAGGFVPRSVGLTMDEAHKAIVKKWILLFLPYGVYDFARGGSGEDVSVLQQQGVPLAGLYPDPQRYFDIHHSANDVFEAVSHRELKLGAFTMTAMIYLVDKYFP